MKSIILPSVWAIAFLAWMLLTEDLVSSQQTDITLEILQTLQNRIDEAKNSIGIQ